MPREVVVLGCASQAPTATRNHNGYLVRMDSLGVLFDPGEGTQRQMLHAGIRSSSIDVIAISHEHGDHCLGLPGVLSRMALDQRRAPVLLVHGRSATTTVDHLLALTHAAEVFEIDRRVLPDTGGEVVLEEGITLRGLPLEHRVPAMGYRLERPGGVRFDPDKLEAAGVRGAAIRQLAAAGQIDVDGRTVDLTEVATERSGQVVAFAMDTQGGAAVEAVLDGADLAIVEATYLAGDEELAARYGHMTAAQAGEHAANAGVRRLLLTHFSQRYAHGRFGEEASSLHPDVVEATDLLVVEVPAAR